MEPNPPHSQDVKTRHVFYIPGYDPIPPRRYRELYRKESAAQADISGYEIALLPGGVDGPYGWRTEARINGTRSAAQIQILVWSDIVRDSMQSGIVQTYGQLLRTAWIYISSGALWRMMRLRKGPVIAALYPVGMLLAQLLVAVLIGLFAGNAIYIVAERLLRMSLGPLISGQYLWLASLLFWGMAALSVAWVLRWFKAKDGRFFAYYLMHDYAFSARWNGAYPEALEARMAQFRATIRAALCSDVDEVLIVGHSSGAYLGVSLLADLIRLGELPESHPKLAFLSLGQVVPMVSFLKDATRLRRDLHILAAQETIPWIDVTAPGDGCAFALCDPVSVSGVAPEDKRWPRVFSAAYTQTLSPERWKALRWRFFRLHFQYLCAFDRPKDYDYFQITSGPLSLGARYADRVQSKSRIDVAVSKYRDMAP